MAECEPYKWGERVPIYSEHYHNKHHSTNIDLFAYNYIEHNGEKIQIFRETTIYREYGFRLICQNCGTAIYESFTNGQEEHAKRIVANNLGEKENCESCKL